MGPFYKELDAALKHMRDCIQKSKESEDKKDPPEGYDSWEQFNQEHPRGEGGKFGSGGGATGANRPARELLKDPAVSAEVDRLLATFPDGKAPAGRDIVTEAYNTVQAAKTKPAEDKPNVPEKTKWGNGAAEMTVAPDGTVSFKMKGGQVLTGKLERDTDPPKEVKKPYWKLVMLMNPSAPSISWKAVAHFDKDFTQYQGEMQKPFLYGGNSVAETPITRDAE